MCAFEEFPTWLSLGSIFNFMRCSLFITVWRIFFKSFSVSKCLPLFFLISIRIPIGTGEEHQNTDEEVPGSPPALSFFFFVFWKWILKKLNQTMMKTIFEFDEINSKVCIKSFNFRIIYFKLWRILFKNLKYFHQVRSNLIMIWCNFTIPWMVFITSIIKEWITSLHL